MFRSENSATFKVFGDRKVTIPLNDGYWIGQLLRGDRYEPEVGHVLRRSLHQDAIFLDCGANIGYWSLYASTLIRPSRIVAVEASPRTFGRLRTTEALNHPAFDIVNAVVWDTSNELVAFADDEERHSWGSADPHIRATLREAGFKEVLVPSVTIDDLRSRVPEASRVVIKLDLEGGEAKALRGAPATLSKDDVVVVFEHHDRSESLETVELLLEAGLSIYRFTGGGLESIEARGVLDAASRDRGKNFVAMRSVSSLRKERS
jgi:FkbM family methyltransferase